MVYNEFETKSASISQMAHIPKTLLVFLHGSGDEGRIFGAYLQSVRLREYGLRTFADVAASMGIDILTPSAESQFYIPTNCRLNVWFNRSSAFESEGLQSSEDLAGVEKSWDRIMQQIGEIETAYEYIFLGGFSMGGGLMLHALRKRLPAKIIGVFSIASFLVEGSKVFAESSLATSTPVLMMHGMFTSLLRKNDISALTIAGFCYS
jgi:predicted esterase